MFRLTERLTSDILGRRNGCWTDLGPSCPTVVAAALPCTSDRSDSDSVHSEVPETFGGNDRKKHHCSTFHTINAFDHTAGMTTPEPNKWAPTSSGTRTHHPQLGPQASPPSTVTSAQHILCVNWRDVRCKLGGMWCAAAACDHTVASAPLQRSVLFTVLSCFCMQPQVPGSLMA